MQDKTFVERKKREREPCTKGLDTERQTLCHVNLTGFRGYSLYFWKRDYNCKDKRCYDIIGKAVKRANNIFL